MKPLDYYREVGTPFPSKSDHTVQYWYKNGAVFARRLPGWEAPRLAPDFKTVPAAADLNKLATERVVDETVYNQLRAEYQAASAILADEFRADALADSGLTGDPAGDVLFDKAWEDGHAHGHSEVLNELERLVDFLAAVDAARSAK